MSTRGPVDKGAATSETDPDTQGRGEAHTDAGRLSLKEVTHSHCYRAHTKPWTHLFMLQPHLRDNCEGRDTCGLCPAVQVNEALAGGGIFLLP